MKAMRLLLLLVVVAVPSFAVPPSVKISPLNFKPAQPDRVTLKNGMVVYIMEDPELPLFSVQLWMKSSPAYEAVPSAFDVMNTWRTGGTMTRTPEQLNDELEFLAASVETGATDDSFSISLSCLSKDIPKGLEIFKDVLMNPAFREEQLTLSKQAVLEGLRRKNDTPELIGRRVFRDVLYGKHHPYSDDPTEKEISAITRNELVSIHKKVVVPDEAIAAVCGNFNKTEMIATLEKLFSDWKPAGRKTAPYDYKPQEPAPGKLFLVEKDFNQSRIIVGRVGVDRLDQDNYALSLADYILGGSGPSRLFGEIRSRRGLAYVVGSFVIANKGPGPLGVITQTKAQTTVAALEAISGELNKFSTGPIRPEELSLAKDSTTNSFIYTFESPKLIVGARAGMEFSGYPSDYLDTYIDRISKLSVDDIRTVAAKYFNLDQMKVIVVGDSKKFDKPLTSVGPVTVIPLAELE